MRAFSAPCESLLADEYRSRPMEMKHSYALSNRIARIVPFRSEIRMPVNRSAMQTTGATDRCKWGRREAFQ